MKSTRSRRIRLYRLLLAAFPERFRDEFGEDMELHLEEALADAREKGKSAGLVWLWACLDAVAEGTAERLRSRPKPYYPRTKGVVVPVYFRDLRHTLRSLAASPGYTLTAVATLAVGIGASTSVFSILNGVLLTPLPYPEPERLVRVFESAPGVPEFPLSPGNFLDYRELPSFEAMAAFRRDDAELSGSDHAASERLSGMRVTAGYFDVLGLAPIRGRAFGREHEVRGRDNVALLSERLWERRFDRDPDIVGTTITLDGQAHLVLGVLPVRLSHVGGSYHSMPAGSIVDVFRPYGFAPEPRRGAHFLNGVARLRRGVTLAQASAELKALASRLADAYPDSNEDWTASLFPLHDEIVRDARGMLLLVSGAVGLVLLVTGVNLAGLLLARGQARQHDLALKSALGARRGRIVTEILLESSVIALAGGSAGLLAASAVVEAVPRFAPEGLPRLDAIALDGRVVAAAFAMTVVTGLLVGLVPALRLSRARVSLASVRTSGGPSEKRWRSVFVVVQIAFALTLLVGAGLLLRTLVNLERIEPGFEPRNVVTARVFLPKGRYPSGAENLRLFTRLIEEAREIPGVSAVGAGSDLPWSGYDENIGVSVEGRDPEERYGTRYHFAMPGYFETLGIPLVAGREFSRLDDAQAERRVLINRALAERIFGDDDPLGARLSFPMTPEEQDWMTIVGVVGNVKDSPRANEAEPALYMAHAQTPWNNDLYVAMRSRESFDRVVSSLRERLAVLDPDLPLAEVALLEERAGEVLAPSRFLTELTSGFAATALLVAVLGLYGVIAQAMARETKAIAIRLALGASQRRVLVSVLGWAFRLVGLGVTLGVVLSLSLGKTLESFLFEITAHDALTFVLATLLLAATAAAAAYLPARRAAGIEPTLALRHD